MNLLKSILSIKTIMCVRLIGGVYYKMSSNRFVTVLSKAYCVLFSMIVIVNNVKSIVYSTTDKIPLGLQVSLYTASVLVNLFCNSENFPALLNRFKEIDNEQDNLRLDDEIPVSRVLFIISLGIRISTHVIFCSLASVSCFLTILALDLTSTITHFTRIMMFESLWLRMRLIRQRFEKKSRVSRWEDNEKISEQILRKCLKGYRSLLKTTELTNATMKPLIFLTTLAVIPKLLNITYSAVVVGHYYRYKAVVLEGLTDFVVSIASAALAELVNSEIDKLKVCIAKQLLFCKGEPARHAIEDAMTYLRQHPFKYTIWRLLTVDMSMILSVLALLTTYTVAMVQFAHFFD